MAGRGEIQILAVTNAATFLPGLPSSGSLATVFCSGLRNIEGVIVAEGVPLPSELAGVTVFIRGLPAPLLAVAAGAGFQQINLQVPWERPVGTLPSLEIRQGGQRVHLDLSGPLQTAAPGFFADAQGLGIVQHSSDFSLVTAESPARPGEILVAYATGLGDVSPPVPTGFPAPVEPLSWAMGAPSVSIGQREANTFFRGLAPGLVGIFQINFQVPHSVPTGDLALAFSYTSCPPFGQCGSPNFHPRVTFYGPSVKVLVR